MWVQADGLAYHTKGDTPMNELEKQTRRNVLAKAFYGIALVTEELEILNPTCEGLAISLNQNDLLLDLEDVDSPDNEAATNLLIDFFMTKYFSIGSEMAIYNTDDGFIFKINGRGAPVLYTSDSFQTSLEAHTFGFEKTLYLLQKSAEREKVAEAMGPYFVATSILKLLSTLPETYKQAVRNSINPADSYLLNPKGLEPDAIEEFEEVPYARIETVGKVIMMNLNQGLGHEYFVNFTVARTNGLTQLNFVSKTLVNNKDFCDFAKYLNMSDPLEDGFFESIASGKCAFPYIGSLHEDTGQGYLSVAVPISVSGWNTACENNLFAYFEKLAVRTLLNESAATFVQAAKKVDMQGVLDYLEIKPSSKDLT